jgi:hypothetical protein
MSSGGMGGQAGSAEETAFYLVYSLDKLSMALVPLVAGHFRKASGLDLTLSENPYWRVISHRL